MPHKNRTPVPSFITRNEQRYADHAGQLRAHCRALAYDLKLVLEDAPQGVQEILIPVFQRDVRRAHELLREVAR